jgi:hypothetical protein
MVIVPFVSVMALARVADAHDAREGLLPPPHFG